MCSGVNIPLVADANYICLRCNGEFRSIGGRPMAQVDVEGTGPDAEAAFFYMGDMLC